MDVTNDLDERDHIVAARTQSTAANTTAMANKIAAAQQHKADIRADNTKDSNANKRKALEETIKASTAARNELEKQFNESVAKYNTQHVRHGYYGEYWSRQSDSAVSGAAPADSPNNVARKTKIAELDAYISACREQIQNLK